MKVGRYDYAGQFPDLDGLTERIRGMLAGGRYVLSPEVEHFERALADYLGAEHVVGVNCGTDALLLSLRVAGIQAGDEVITQANTFHATVSAILWAGAVPVLVDADPDTFEMDATQLESVRTDRTRAILPVHLYGKPAPMRAVQEFASKHGLLLVEDAAQAIGARVGGQRVGTLGALAGISFHPSKNLAAAGDGGAIVCRSAEHAAELRVLRSLGQSGPNDHTHVGMNSKLDAIQAVVLHAKLPMLDEWNHQRREIAQAYRAGLEGLPVTPQATDADEEHVYHLFQVRTTARDALMGSLQAKGVDAVVRYPQAIHLQPAFAECGWSAGAYPVAERLAQELIALPVRPGMPRAEVDYVCACVREFFADGGGA